MAGRREDALRPIPSATDAPREFWTNEMHGLTECLDTRQAGSPDRRAAEAARWFRDAASRLADMAALDVRNLAFCTAIQSFGSVERFAKNEFQPGEEVLLYAEIENFATDSTKAGHRTAFKALECPRNGEVIHSRARLVSTKEVGIATTEFEIDLIFHLAALLSSRAEFTPMAGHHVNVEGTLNLLEFAAHQASVCGFCG